MKDKTTCVFHASQSIATTVMLLLHTCGVTHGAGNVTDSENVPDIVYDEVTGNVILVAVDDPIIVFNLENDNGSFRNENTMFPFINIGTNTTNTPDRIEQGEALPLGFTGSHDLGEVFPAGIASSAELANYLTAAEFGTFFAAGEFDLIVVPEPSSLITCILGAFALLRLRPRESI